MNNKISLKERKKVAKDNFLHFGLILSNLQILCIWITLLPTITQVAVVIYIFFLLMLVLVTLGAIFAIVDNFGDKFSGTEKIIDAVNNFIPNFIYIGPAIIAISLLSVIIISLNAERKYIWRYVLSLVTIGFAIYSIIVAARMRG